MFNLDSAIRVLPAAAEDRRAMTVPRVLVVHSTLLGVKYRCTL